MRTLRVPYSWDNYKEVIRAFKRLLKGNIRLLKSFLKGILKLYKAIRGFTYHLRNYSNRAARSPPGRAMYNWREEGRGEETLCTLFTP